MKLKHQEKANTLSHPGASPLSIGTKVTIIASLILAVVAYMRQRSSEEMKLLFVEAQVYCTEQGKLLSLT
jgi:hypothetical protein